MSVAMAGTDSPETRKDGATDAALRARRQRARSIAIALALGALVILFYLVTVVKLGPGIVERPL